MIKIRIYSLLFVALANSAVAQDLSKPKDFYESDFAKSPMQKSRDKVPEKSGVEEIQKNEGGKSKSSADSEIFKDVGLDQSNGSDKKQASSVAEEAPLTGRSIKVLSVGVILNTLDKDHAIQKLEELSELATKYDWSVGLVLSIGDSANIALTLPMKKLMARGAILKSAFEPPPVYKEVKMSPTWLVTTAEGQVLLEATGSLKRYFDQNGSFILSETSVTSGTKN